MGSLSFGSAQVGAPGLITDEPSGYTGGLVSGRFAQAEAYGASAWTTAQDLLSALSSQLYEVDWTIDPWVAVDTMGLEGLAMSPPQDPEISSAIDVDDPGFSEPIPRMDEITVNIESVPEPNVTDPGFDVPAPPNTTFPIFSENPPDVQYPDTPTAPAYDLPAVPVLDSISIPSPPEYNFPTFDGELPVTDLTPPEPAFTWSEALYTSDIKDALADKLLTDIINGGSGLDNDTEQAIYDRATSRTEADNERMYTEALNFFESRGHILPPGALAGQLIEISHRINQTREDLDNDILVQQSNLAQKNTHFIIEQAIVNEKHLMDYTSQYEQRSFEAAKFTVEAALIVYQAKVEAYKAQLEVYKTQAQVYETKIKAEIARAELYKAQIEGVKASVEVQRALVEAYKAQVEAVTSLIEAYKVEMEGAAIKAEIEKIMVEAYRNQVEAYKARVQAVTEQYNAYSAQMSGEVAKAQMYEAQWRGYAAHVDAYKSKAEVEISKLQAEVEEHKANTESFKAVVEKYRAQAQVEIEKARTEIELEKLDVAIYDAKVRKYEAEVEAVARVFLGKVEEAKAKKEIEIKEAEVAVQEAMAKYGLAEKASEAAARVAGQVAASSLSTISATAALGYREGRNDSRSLGNRNSYAYSETGYHYGEYHYFHYHQD